MVHKNPVTPLPRTRAWALRLWALWLCFFSVVQLEAQTTAPQAASPTTRKPPEKDEPLLFTLALTPEKSELATDTLPDRPFRMYNPTRQSMPDYGNLGNLGSAARPLLYEIMPQQGFDLGIHGFDLYALRPKDLRFYKNSKSYTDAFFSQGKNNLETMVKTRFARTFADGTNFSLDYRSINNLGQYEYQLDRHNSLNAGLWVPKGKRYDAFFIYSRTVVRQKENGGIVSDDVFAGDQFQGPLAAAVHLSDLKAYTRYDEQALHLTQHYKFAGVNEGMRSLRATYTIEWSKQRYKFYDGDSIKGLQSDTSYFDYFLTDIRGLRNFVSLHRIDNTFSLSTFKSKKPGTPSDLLAVGIAHSYFNVYQEPLRSKFSNLFFTGNLNFRPSSRFVFAADAALGMLKNIGEYRLHGTLQLGLGKAGSLKAELLSQRRPPALLQERLYVSKREVWDNRFEKPVENALSASYSLPVAGFEATARTLLVNNFIYFDQQRSPVQTTSPLQVAQLILTENVHWRWLHFDNSVAFQQANRSDIFRLPKWFSKNSFYINGPLFKKRLLLSTGVDFSMNGDFTPDGYHPLIGQFHLQDTLQQAPYPWIDVFLAFKVQAFRFFMRYENCATWWDKTRVFYQTAPYPQPFGALRFGVSWRFMDNNVKGPGDKDDTNSSGSQSGDPNRSGGLRGRKQF